MKTINVAMPKAISTSISIALPTCFGTNTVLAIQEELKYFILSYTSIDEDAIVISTNQSVDVEIREAIVKLLKKHTDFTIMTEVRQDNDTYWIRYD